MTDRKQLYITNEKFDELYNLDVGPYISNEQGFDYLKISYLPVLLRRHLPTLDVCFIQANDGSPLHRLADGTGYVLPYLRDRETMEETAAIFFPIMGNPPRYAAIENPNSRELNDALARASVKCVAFQTGLGLKLYTRENEIKPDSRKKKATTKPEITKVVEDDDDLY